MARIFPVLGSMDARASSRPEASSTGIAETRELWALVCLSGSSVVRIVIPAVLSM